MLDLYTWQSLSSHEQEIWDKPSDKDKKVILRL